MIYKYIIASMKSGGFDKDSNTQFDCLVNLKAKVPIGDIGLEGKLWFVQSNKEEDLKWKPLILSAYEEKEIFL